MAKQINLCSSESSLAMHVRMIRGRNSSRHMASCFLGRDDRNRLLTGGFDEGVGAGSGGP